MNSREMIEVALEKAMKDENLVRGILIEADKHILFKLMHRLDLGYSEAALKKALEAIGCKYPQ